MADLVQAIGDGLAAVEGFQGGELFVIGAHEIGQLQQYLLACLRRGARPGAILEDTARCC